ncbi:MAG: hypothetical protein U0T84_01215 [Chitinophagales bacterium]
MTTAQWKAYELLKRQFKDEEALILVTFQEEKMEQTVNQWKQIFLTKEDKVDLMRTIYLVGAGQLLAIVGAVLAIAHFGR